MEAPYTEHNTYHTDWAVRVAEQTFDRSLAQLHGTETIKEISVYCWETFKESKTKTDR